MNHSQSPSNANLNGEQDAESERTDPTRLSVPYVDTSMRYEGYRLRPFVYGMPGYLGAFLVVVLDAFTDRPFLYFFETTGAFLLLGGLCTVYGITINEELTSPADHFRSLVGRVLYRRKYPLGYARLLADPIHNVDRISLFQNDIGVAEMTDGRYVAAVHIGGQHTEHKDGEQLDALARNLTSSIRSNMDSDFNIHITTFDTDPEEFLQSYRDAVHSDRFAGSRWRWVREILWDILDYEHREAEQWDAREQRTYLFVSVSPGEVSGHRKSTKTTSVFGGGDAAIRHKQMRRQLRDRIEGAVTVGHTGEDSSVTVIGPSELALLLSNYYAGTEHALDSDERVAHQLNASVWPTFDEYEQNQEQDGDQSHQPSAVDNRELDPRGGVADVAVAGSEAEAASGAVADGGAGTEADSGSESESGSGASSRPVQSTTTAGTPEAIGEQSTAANADGDGTGDTDATTIDSSTAAWLAAIRDGLLEPLNLEHVVDDGMSEIMASLSLADTVSAFDHDPIAATLSPSTFNPRGDHITVGDQYVRCYWLTGWPVSPNPHFLTSIQTLAGVDFDLTIRAQAMTSRNAKAEIETQLDKIGATVSEKQSGGEHGVGTTQHRERKYQEMHGLLEETPATPWKLSGYLVVRAGSKRALDLAESEIASGVETRETHSLDIAKRRALENSADDATDALEEEPADLIAVTDYGAHRDLFLAASPVEIDQYQANSLIKDRYTPALDGTLGAMLPYARSTVREPDGVEYGRSLHHRGKIVADQFDRDGPPHKLTIGDSGSGKTYNCGKQAVRWWVAGDNRFVESAPASASESASEARSARDPATHEAIDTVQELLDTDEIPDNSPADRHDPGQNREHDGDGDEDSDGFSVVDDDRTVIFADTQGGFLPHIEATNGQHIVVDGQTTLNPMDIQETPAEYAAATDVDPFQMAVDSLVEFLRSIITSQGDYADASDLVPLMEEIAIKTYTDNGILPGQPATHSRPSPTMDEYLANVELALNEPTEFGVTDANEFEAEKIREEAQALIRKLSGFRGHGNYRNLVGQTDQRIELGKTNYIDMQQIEDKGNADKATTLSLILRKIYEAVKRADGEVLVIIDEAHYLLHSDAMIEWLQRASRHWRHHGAGLWSLSQTPDEFVSGKSDEHGHKDTIRGQCPIIEWFQVDELDWETAAPFDMNRNQYQWITTHSTTGESDADYSSGMVNFRSESEWYTFEVSVGPVEHAMLTYDPAEDGDFDEYMALAVAYDPAEHGDFDEYMNHAVAATTDSVETGDGIADVDLGAGVIGR